PLGVTDGPRRVESIYDCAPLRPRLTRRGPLVTRHGQRQTPDCNRAPFEPRLAGGSNSSPASPFHEQLRDPSHRDPRPRRPVVQLVRQLVERLFSFEQGEQLPDVRFVFWNDRRIVVFTGFEVAGQVRGAHVALPARSAELAGSRVERGAGGGG